MYQYDDPSASSVLPTPAAPGTAGYFTDGNPGGGVPATILRSDFMNSIMMELLNILTAAGITPSKTAYNQVASAIPMLAKTNTPGRVLNIRRFTSSTTYTPTTGTTAIFYRMVGGGGAGGGAPATGSGQASVGAPGAAGAYAEGYLTSGFSGASLVIGAAGAGVSGGTGGTGGTTSGFGISCPGGTPGGWAGPTTPPWIVGTAATPGPTGSPNLIGMPGSAGVPSIAINSTGGYGGPGGNSPMGAGGGAAAVGGGGQGAGGCGAGGSGTMQAQSASALTGGPASGGCIEIWEFGAI